MGGFDFEVDDPSAFASNGGVSGLELGRVRGGGRARGSSMTRRESIYVGGLCGRRATLATQLPDRYPDRWSSCLATKKLSSHRRPKITYDVNIRGGKGAPGLTFGDEL